MCAHEPEPAEVGCVIPYSLCVRLTVREDDCVLTALSWHVEHVVPVDWQDVLCVCVRARAQSHLGRLSVSCA